MCPPLLYCTVYIYIYKFKNVIFVFHVVADNSEETSNIIFLSIQYIFRSKIIFWPVISFDTKEEFNVTKTENKISCATVPCSACPILPVLFNCSLLSVFICLYPSAYPLLPVLFCPSFSACPFPTCPTSCLSCSCLSCSCLSCSCLSRSGCPVLAVLCWLSCFGGPDLSILFWLSYSGCPALSAVLSWLSCPVFKYIYRRTNAKLGAKIKECESTTANAKARNLRPKKERDSARAGGFLRERDQKSTCRSIY